MRRAPGGRISGVSTARPMPTFETERPGAPPETLRARDAADAVRRAHNVPADAVVAVADPSGPDGWCEATVNGTPAGRVRPHARMRFRRD